MTVRIDFPFYGTFEHPDFVSNSRELRTQALHVYLLNSGLDLGHDIEDFEVKSFSGDDNGEHWEVKAGKY